MPEVQSISADALIKLLQKPQPTSAPTQEQILAAIASPVADRSRQSGRVSAEDLIDVLEAGQPGSYRMTYSQKPVGGDITERQSRLPKM